MLNEISPTENDRHVYSPFYVGPKQKQLKQLMDTRTDQWLQETEV